MSRHWIIADCPIGFGTISVSIEYNWSAGHSGDGPGAWFGPTPDEPDEVELFEVVVRGVTNPTILDFINEWAWEYLAGDGYEKACQRAQDDVGHKYDRPS